MTKTKASLKEGDDAEIQRLRQRAVEIQRLRSEARAALERGEPVAVRRRTTEDDLTYIDRIDPLERMRDDMAAWLQANPTFQRVFPPFADSAMVTAAMMNVDDGGALASRFAVLGQFSPRLFDAVYAAAVLQVIPTGGG